MVTYWDEFVENVGLQVKHYKSKEKEKLEWKTALLVRIVSSVLSEWKWWEAVVLY